MLSAFGPGIIAVVFFNFATHLPTWSKNRHAHTETHAHAHKHTSMHKHSTHTHTLACTNIHMHMCTIGMHTTHTCKAYIDALVIIVCCFVLVNIELAMGMM